MGKKSIRRATALVLLVLYLSALPFLSGRFSLFPSFVLAKTAGFNQFAREIAGQYRDWSVGNVHPANLPGRQGALWLTRPDGMVEYVAFNFSATGVREGREIADRGTPAGRELVYYEGAGWSVIWNIPTDTLVAERRAKIESDLRQFTVNPRANDPAADYWLFWQHSRALVRFDLRHLSLPESPALALSGLLAKPALPLLTLLVAVAALTPPAYLIPALALVSVVLLVLLAYLVTAPNLAARRKF